MGELYFVTSSLPRLNFGEPPEIDFEGLMQLLKANLSPSEIERVRRVRRLIDFTNLCPFWRGGQLDPHGNLSREKLEEELQLHEELPEFLYDFLEKYETNEERLAHHDELMHHFFEEAIPKESGLLCELLQFERDWRLVMTAYRAKALGRDLSEELQWEDPNDMIVAQLLAQKDADVVEPPDGFEELAEIYREWGSDPHELFVRLEEYRFRKVGEMREGLLFTLDVILGYMVQLMILERSKRALEGELSTGKGT